MKIGDKVEVLVDIITVDGMLRADTTVIIDKIPENSDDKYRVKDNLGKIHWVEEKHLDG